jgi:IS605 OrfB family transposase
MKITVKSRVTDDSVNKLSRIAAEYQNYQTYLQSNCDANVNLYSATRQQAERALKRMKRPNPRKEYPVILRGDLINIQKDSKFEGVYWMHTPVYPKSINIRIRTSSKYNLGSSEYEIQECKLIRVSKKWFIFITVEKDDWLLPTTNNVVAVDLGCHNIAVTVNTANDRPNFYGRLLREIRGFYFYLRRQLGKKKALDTIKSIGDREFMRVNHELHKISKLIVGEAIRTNAVIVVGKLKGVRKNIKGSKRTKRLINNFTYYRLLQYIKYKAEWTGVMVLEVGEAYTSQTCSDCHHRSKLSRKKQGLFKCVNCHKEMNADCNGARNILQRGLGILSNLGGFLTYPKSACLKAEEPSMIAVKSRKMEPHIL